MFEHAKFGDKFKTRDGRMAIYHSYENIYPDNPYQSHHNLILQEKDGKRDTIWIWANDFGHTDEHIEGDWIEETNSDIVSVWEEPINESQLEMLATEEANGKWDRNKSGYSSWGYKCTREAFKNGYYRAKNEK